MDPTQLTYWRDAPKDALDAFFEFAPVMMHTLDADGKLTNVSTFGAAALGFTREEMLGQDAMDFLTPASQSYIESELVQRMRQDGRIESAEVEMVHRDGTVIDALFSGMAEISAEGEIARVIAVLIDNRAAKSAERQLAEKAREAEEASRAKSRFLAAMSHEIRTPMNAIMGFAQLLEMSDLDGKRQSHVKAIINAGGTMMNLLTDLLDLSQVEEGRMRIETREFDLYELLDQVANWWHSAAVDKGLKLSVTLDHGLPRRIVSDPTRIQQVLNNFLGNAVKFTEQGRISLSVEEIAGTLDTTRLRFQVSDTGPGMDPDQMARLFKPFVQIETDFSKDRGGWGLGLSICHNIAQALGAEIGVSSEAGHGATFHFEIDAEKADPEADRAVDDRIGQALEDEAAKGLHVLLAEDNSLNQDVMCSILRDMGHRVVTVANGFEAVEALLKGRFDLVIMDIMMPGLDGIGAVEQIRTAAGDIGKVPIVACSAYVSAEARDRYREVGMDGFLPKPIDRDELQAVISDVLSGDRRA